MLAEYSEPLPVDKNALSKEDLTAITHEQVTSALAVQNDENDDQVPTEEELTTLRRVSAPMP